MSDWNAKAFLVWYADLFTTRDRCAYCWWLRGVLFHLMIAAVANAFLFGGVTGGALVGSSLAMYTIYLWATHG